MVERLAPSLGLRTATSAARPGVPPAVVGRRFFGLRGRRPRLSLEDRTIGAASRISGLSMKLQLPGTISLPFFPFPLRIPYWIAGALSFVGLKSAVPATDMVFQAPIDALRGVKGKNWNQVPARFAQQVSTIARGAEGTWIGKKLADPKVPVDKQLATRAAARLQSGGKSFSEFVARTFGPVRSAVKSGAARFDSTRVGQAVSGRLNSLANWRANRSMSGSGKAAKAATQAFTAEPTGIFRRAINFITGAKPGSPGLAPELSAAKALADKGQLMRARVLVRKAGREATAALGQENISDVARQAATRVAGQAAAVQGQLAKSVAAEAGAKSWRQMAGTNMTGMLQGASRMVGNLSMFQIALGATVTAGAIAIGLSTRKQNREAKRARADLSRMLGNNPNHPLLLVVDKSHRPQRWGRRMTATAQAAGNALFLIPGMGYYAAGLGILPTLAISRFVSDDGMLNAFVGLQQPGVPDEQRVLALRQLMAPLPATPTDEPDAPVIGPSNRLSAAMAEEWVQNKTPLQEIMTVIGDRKKFFAFAETVNAKHHVTEAAQATQAPVQAAPVVAQAAASNNQMMANDVAIPEGGWQARIQKERAAAAMNAATPQPHQA